MLLEVLGKGEQLLADIARVRLGLVRGKMAVETKAGGVRFSTAGVLARVDFFHFIGCF
jgi:hypothetical protein